MTPSAASAPGKPATPSEVTCLSAAIAKLDALCALVAPPKGWPPMTQQAVADAIGEVLVLLRAAAGGSGQ